MKLKFEGKRLNFGERASVEHLNQDDENRFWRGENVIFEREEKCIKTGTEELVKSKLSDKGKALESIKGTINRTDNLTELKSSLISLREEFKSKISVYLNISAGEKLNPDERMFINETRYCTLLEKSSKLTTLLAIVILFEFLVLLAQGIGVIIFDIGWFEFSIIFAELPTIFVILLQATLLAFGGYLIGLFLGKWQFERELKNNKILTETEKVKPSHIGLMAIGILKVLFVSIVRGIYGGGIMGAVITLILGAAVAVVEMKREFRQKLKSYIGAKRLMYYREEATEKHKKEINNYYTLLKSKVIGTLSVNDENLINEIEKELYINTSELIR